MAVSRRYVFEREREREHMHVSTDNKWQQALCVARVSGAMMAMAGEEEDP